VKRMPEVGPRTVPIRASEGYRLWARTYDADPNPILALESRILGPRLRGIAGEVVVDIGCGTGRWMTYAAEKGARTAGADLCIEMLRVASAKPRLNGRLALAECGTLPFRDGVADIAICSFTIGYVSDPCRVIRELSRITKPGGILFITDFHPQTRARGWRRTFRDGEVVYELMTRPVDVEQLLACGHDARLRLLDVCEPHMEEPESVLMHEAGMGDRFAEVSAIPAILLIEWERA